MIIFVFSGCTSQFEEANGGTHDETPNQTQNQTPTQPQDYVRGATESKDIPDAIEDNCIGFLIGAPEEAVTIAKIGGAWARPHPGPFAWEWMEPEQGQFSFEATDNWVRQAQSNGIAILATIWPYAKWDQVACHSEKCRVTEMDQFYPVSKDPQKDSGKQDNDHGIPAYRCAPCNMDNYKAFLSRLVERYDGDGADDMPGLEIPIKYWEVMNEPEMADQHLTFFIGTQAEYAKILEMSHAAIKTTCPDCKIVQGGMANTMPESLDYWSKVLKLGAADHLDIANIHYINNGDRDSLNVKDIKKLYVDEGISRPIPVWVTEAQYSLEDRDIEIEASVEGALAAGAERIFFTQFEIGRFGPPRFGEYSAVYDTVVGKCN